MICSFRYLDAIIPARHTKFSVKRVILTAISFLSLASIVSGSAKFESQILPLLEKKCFKCHGQDKQKSDLRLDSVAVINKGGSSGEPLFVRGNSSQSLIIHLINSANSSSSSARF